MSANNEQVGGTHYVDMAVQPWDAMQAWMSDEAFQGYLLGNVIKYAARHKAKGGVDDLRKARHYLDRLIERYEGVRAAKLPEVADVLADLWPGPDWSQAPEWAMWWTHDKAIASGIWASCELTVASHCNGGFWVFSRATPSSRSAPAPGFGFPGDWRDSLRKRPK